MEIRPCDGCESCSKRFSCHIEDGMSLIYEEFKRADVIAVASPVYFGGISGQLKQMMDRTLCLYYGKQLKNKIGAALATMGLDGGDLVLEAIDRFFQYHQIIYAGGVFGRGGIEKDVIEKDEGAEERVKSLGERIRELYKIRS